MSSSSPRAGSSGFGGLVLVALALVVVVPFLVLDGPTACPVAGVGSQLVLLLGLVMHGLAKRSGSNRPDQDELDAARTPQQRTFHDRVDASRYRERMLYRVTPEEPVSAPTHDGIVYEAPDGDPAVTLGSRGLRQDEAWLLWKDVLAVGVVVDGAARLEVLTPDGIRALWLAKATRPHMAKLLWMVGEIRRHAAARADQDEGEASEVPTALRRLASREQAP